MSVCLFVCEFVCLSVCKFVCLSVCESVCQFVSFSVKLLVARMSVCRLVVFVCHSVCLVVVRLSLCMSVVYLSVFLFNIIVCLMTAGYLATFKPSVESTSFCCLSDHLFNYNLLLYQSTQKCKIKYWP